MARERGAEIDGRVVATAGRKVVVEAGEDTRVCHLTGLRAVIGDRVRWVDAGTGEGKLVEVLPRARDLGRTDFKGRDQPIAAHLGGLVIVAAADRPAYRSGLVDRYAVGASSSDLPYVVCLTKTDLGVSPEIEVDLARRAADGVPVVRVCVPTGDGLQGLVGALAEAAAPGPWAFVGHSGVGKTSLAQRLLPDVDVGPVGDISDHWEAGRHTTTHSRIFRHPAGFEIADSPGIRTFLPSGLDARVVRDHFPALGQPSCRYRDCLHRPDEDGCVAPAAVDGDVLVRYRRMLGEVLDVSARTEAHLHGGRRLPPSGGRRG